MSAAANDPMTGVEDSLEGKPAEIDEELEANQQDSIVAQAEDAYESGKEYPEETAEYMKDHPFEMGLYGGMAAIDPAAAVIAEGLEIAGEAAYDRAESFRDNEDHHIYTDVLH